MSNAGERLFVVTGGPGSGKSTLLAAAAEAGYRIVPEAGRSILQRQALIGGRAGHTKNPELYAELMLDRDVGHYLEHAESDRPVLFDRGIGDLIGYRTLIGKPLGPHFARAAEILRYNPVVFIAPPWEVIYVNDSERKQGWTKAVRTYEVMHAAYESLGYQLAVLPEADVVTRLHFVMERVGPA